MQQSDKMMPVQFTLGKDFSIEIRCKASKYLGRVHCQALCQVHLLVLLYLSLCESLLDIVPIFSPILQIKNFSSLFSQATALVSVRISVLTQICLHQKTCTQVVQGSACLRQEDCELETNLGYLCDPVKKQIRNTRDFILGGLFRNLGMAIV